MEETRMSENTPPESADRTFELRDGRKLGYAEYGDPNGVPIFHFHGWPGSRYEAWSAHEVAARLGVRMIGVDRPGAGLSDFQPRRKLLDWPDDVQELADGLGFERFGVEGASGGGPYVLACAYKIPERLTACGLMAGMGPYGAGIDDMQPGNRQIFSIARRFPWLLRPLFALSYSRIDHQKMQEDMEKSPHMPQADKDAMKKDEKLRNALMGSTQEAFRQGAKGQAYEGRIYAGDWGFELEDIRCEKIFIWQGEQDVNVPPSMARYMAERIPNSRTTLYPKDGHVSLIANNLEEMLQAMIS
jgi:pimeloyl-ACP methyl ester carboxylesterase